MNLAATREWESLEKNRDFCLFSLGEVGGYGVFVCNKSVLAAGEP